MKKIEKEELMQELSEEFEKIKKELGFKATLEELEEIFFIKDYVLQIRFISTSLSRLITWRIRELLDSWINQIHAWIIPNPSSMILMSESQLLTEQEKQSLTKMMNKFREFTSRNTVIGLTKNKKEEAKYIDDSINLWNENKEELIKTMQKIQNYWEEQSQPQTKPKML